MSSNYNRSEIMSCIITLQINEMPCLSNLVYTRAQCSELAVESFFHNYKGLSNNTVSW